MTKVSDQYFLLEINPLQQDINNRHPITSLYQLQQFNTESATFSDSYSISIECFGLSKAFVLSGNVHLYL